MDTNSNRQQDQVLHVNTFVKGMNTDLAYDFVSNQLYLFGKNIRIMNNAVLYGQNDSNNTNGVVAPVPLGKTIQLHFEDVDPSTMGYDTQGWWTGEKNLDDTRDVLFKKPILILAAKTVDNIGAVILKYEPEEDGKSYWRVFRVIDRGETITITHVYTSIETTDRNAFSIAINKETSDLTKLYIVDGVHSMMVINLTDKDMAYYKTLTENEISSNRVFPDSAPIFVLKISGTLKTSQVQYAYRLYKKHGVCSKMSPLTHKIQVVSNSRLTDIGNEEDTQSSVGFRLRIDINPRQAYIYDKLQLYRIQYVQYGEPPVCNLIWDAKFEKPEYSAESTKPIEFFVSDNGLQPLQEYTVDEFNQLSGLSIVPLLIEYNQQYMFAADIKDETIIKISDSEVDMSAYSCNADKKIVLYPDALYAEDTHDEYTDINDLFEDTNRHGYLHRHVDMSQLDYFSKYNYVTECVYLPGKDDLILGGAGKHISWKMVARRTPIHENVYTEHVSDNNYGEPNSAQYMHWGFTKRNPNYSYETHQTDVPRVSSSDNIYYNYIGYNNTGSRLSLVGTSDPDVTNDQYYLKQHNIDVKERTNSYDDLFTSSMFRSLQRGETYRYGIVFYDADGNRTDTKYIADIRVPSEKELPLTDVQDNTLYATYLGIQFKLRLDNGLEDILKKYNITKYEIVRCKKTPEYSKTLILVAVSRPLSLKQFSTESGSETTYYPYYPSPLLTTDPYQIGFKLNVHLGGDYASCSEVNNYHRGTDPNKHDLDFLQLFSPEILYRREDTLDVLTGSNTQLMLIRYQHNGMTLNDYDVYFRCKNQYMAHQYGDNNIADTSRFKISTGEHLFTLLYEYLDCVNRCIEYGQCFKNWTVLQLLPGLDYSLLEESSILPHSGFASGINMNEHASQPAEWNSSGTNEIHDIIDSFVGLGITLENSDSSYKRNIETSLRNSAWDSDAKRIIHYMSDAYLNIGRILKNGKEYRYRMFTPYPVINRAYLENDKDRKQNECYVFKNYYSEYTQDYTVNKWKEGETTYDKYYVSGTDEIQIDSISDVQNPLWEDCYEDVELTSSIVESAVKKYKTYLTSVGNKTYCNWSCGGLYNFKAGSNDTVARINSNYGGGKSGYSRIQHLYNPSAEISKGYGGQSDYWSNRADCDFWTHPSRDIRWSNAWFGPGPVCFMAKLKSDFGKMDFEYGQCMIHGSNRPFKTNTFETSNEIVGRITSSNKNDGYKNTHAKFSSFGTWVCNITHTAINFSGITKQERYYDSYVSFGNVCPIEQSQVVFDGDIYILPCEFTTQFKTYDKNATSTLDSQQFVYYIPMESKINVCLDYGMNYRNSKNPNMQLEPGDMEGVASQDRPLHQYNYIYSDNNNSIVNYIANYDENEITTVEHRIIYSEPKTNGEDIEQWGVFRAANFIDADSHYGQITYLFTIKDILHFWQTRAFGRLTVNERSLVTDENSNSITLGTGGVVQRTDYIDTNYGMKRYDMCATNAENNVFWIDRTNNILAAYAQNRVQSIGEYCGVLNYINCEIDENVVPKIHYDINSKEVVAKFLSNGDQMVYNTRAGVVTSIYDRKYDDILEFNNVLYGINVTDNTVTKYNFLSSTEVTDYLHPAKLSFLVNIAPEQTKVFDNQKIVTPQRAEYATSNSQEYDKNYMLNKRYTFTTDIHSAVLQQVLQQSYTITDREANILYAIPRYGNEMWGNRLNGKWMKVDFEFMLDYEQNGIKKYILPDDRPISQVITKFRRSYV